MPKAKQLKIYSFLCGWPPYNEYEHVIAYDLRQCKKAAVVHFGTDILRYLPGGDLFSSSDYGISDVTPGMVVQ